MAERLMAFVLNLAAGPGFPVDVQTLRTMHFMLLSHESAKSPGQYRSGPLYVQDERTGDQVYEGPAAARVPALMDAFARSIQSEAGVPTLITAAMAHLNLVMIHAFRDGNGRLARAVQTLVLAQDAILEPTFSSIEEWLGHNTDDYYRILARTGAGGWNCERSARLWVKFNLRAHHMQAQTVQRRFNEAERVLTAIHDLAGDRGLRASDRSAPHGDSRLPANPAGLCAGGPHGGTHSVARSQRPRGCWSPHCARTNTWSTLFGRPRADRPAARPTITTSDHHGPLSLAAQRTSRAVSQ